MRPKLERQRPIWYGIEPPPWETMIFRLGKVLNALLDHLEDAGRLGGDEVVLVVVVRLLRRRRVDQGRDVQLDHLLVQRVPVLVAHAGRRRPAALVRVRVDHDADETEIVDAAVDLGERVGDRHAGTLGQPGHAAVARRRQLDAHGDGVVVGLDPVVDDLLRLFRVHQLERSRRQELHVRADFVEVVGEVVLDRIGHRLFVQAGMPFRARPWKTANPPCTRTNSAARWCGHGYRRSF